MKRYLAFVFCGVWFLPGCSRNEPAEKPAPAALTAEEHVAIAKAAAFRPGHDFTLPFETLCAQPDPADPAPAQPTAAAQPLRIPTAPPRAEWFVEPAKVFDNLHYIGSSDGSSWAVTTSDGIIVIDTGFQYSIEELADKGLRKLGLDPAQIKYVIVTHAHSDHYFGAKYLQDKFHPRIVISEADWNTIENDDYPADIKPKRDIVATDGMKLTLGDTTLTLYVTPGHTPGTISALIPLKDGNQQHLGSLWGGMTFGFQRAGVQYFPTMDDALRSNSSQAKRYKGLVAQAGADVFISSHGRHDKTFDKLNALKARKPGDPHPFVSSDAIERHLTVISECSDAQLAWRKSPA